MPPTKRDRDADVIPAEVINLAAALWNGTQDVARPLHALQIKGLGSAGINVHLLDGSTLMHLATLDGGRFNRDVAEKLLALGGDINSVHGSLHLTPLDAAMRREDHRVIDWLLTKGAKTRDQFRQPAVAPEAHPCTPTHAAQTAPPAQILFAQSPPLVNTAAQVQPNTVPRSIPNLVASAPQPTAPPTESFWQHHHTALEATKSHERVQERNEIASLRRLVGDQTSHINNLEQTVHNLQTQLDAAHDNLKETELRLHEEKADLEHRLRNSQAQLLRFNDQVAALHGSRQPVVNPQPSASQVDKGLTPPKASGLTLVKKQDKRYVVGKDIVQLDGGALAVVNIHDSTLLNLLEEGKNTFFQVQFSGLRDKDRRSSLFHMIATLFNCPSDELPLITIHKKGDHGVAKVLLRTSEQANKLRNFFHQRYASVEDDEDHVVTVDPNVQDAANLPKGCTLIHVTAPTSMSLDFGQGIKIMAALKPRFEKKASSDQSESSSRRRQRRSRARSHSRSQRE